MKSDGYANLLVVSVTSGKCLKDIGINLIIITQDVMRLVNPQLMIFSELK